MNAHWISTTILVAHWLIVVGLSLRVVTRRSPVGVSVAWMAVMFAVPFVGAGVYLLFGEKRLGRRRGKRMTERLAEVRGWQVSLEPTCRAAGVGHDPRTEPLERLAERVFGFPVQAGNRLELLDGFQRIFDALVADIEGARVTCHLSFYLWHEGGRVIEVVDALVRAARRGVRCRVLADAVGSQRFLRGELADRLRRGGVEVRTALPAGPLPAVFSRLDLRNHRKIAAIDGRVAYTGSQNLVDPRHFMQAAGVGEWVDAMVRITGPAVNALDGVFDLDWALESGAAFEPPARVEPWPQPPAGARVQVAPSGPGLGPEAIHQLLLTAVYGARSELVMTTPYFVPGEAMLTALLSAAQRGVGVTLIVPARNDSLLVRYAGAAPFEDLLSAGVRIALFEGGLLHTKSLTVDGETSIFGSVNLDMRSLWLNFEISLLVYDAAFTAQLRSLQDRYLEASELVDLEVWRGRPRWRRLAEDTIRLLGPLL